MAFTTITHPQSRSITQKFPRSTPYSTRQSTGQGLVRAHQPRRIQYAWLKLMFLAFFALSTTSFSRPLAAQTAPCDALLTNGGFEATTSWQVKNSDGLSIFTTQIVHSGHQSAYLGGRHNAADRLSTPLELPEADETTLTLRFWWQLQSQEMLAGNDELTILIVSQSGASHNVLGHLTGRDASQTWQLLSFDLSQFAGQSIQLQFLSHTDAQAITDFFIDDVEVLACGT